MRRAVLLAALLLCVLALGANAKKEKDYYEVENLSLSSASMSAALTCADAGCSKRCHAARD